MADVDAARNGSYTCQASIDSSSSFITRSGKTSGSITITVGEYQRIFVPYRSAFPVKLLLYIGCMLYITHPSGAII
jgi:hypothetical protein